MRSRLRSAACALVLVVPSTLAGCWLTSSLDSVETPAADGKDGAPSAVTDANTDFGPDVTVIANGDDASVDAGSDATPAHEDDGGDASEVDPVDTGSPDAAMPCLVSSYFASVKSDYPTAYYRFDETSGNVANDDSISRMYTGTYSAGVTLGVPGLKGISGDTAALFDGTQGIMKLAADAGPTFPGLTTFTIEAWINPSLIDGEYRGILSNESPTTANRGGFTMLLQSSEVAVERWANSTSNPALFAPDAGAVPITVGSWSHIVGTFDGVDLLLYVNGKFVYEYSKTPVSIPGPYTFVVGALFSATQPTFFKGAIDEVALYDHPLSPRCILAHYRIGNQQSP